MRPPSKLLPLVIGSAVFAACFDRPPSPDRKLAAVNEPITSDAARILDFQFQAEVIAPKDTDARKAIVSQLMYTQGQLTMGHKANGQVGNVKLSDVHERSEGGNKRIGYGASMPVAWPKDSGSPRSLELVLPLDLTKSDAFNAKYDGRCGKHDYEQASFWHDWNPGAEGCSIDEADVTRSGVSIAPSARATSNKYPEYDLIWADGKLTIVAVFALISSSSHDDWGYTGAKSFAENTLRQLEGANVKRNSASSTILTHTTITGQAMLGGGLGDVQVDVIVTDKELNRVGGGDFDARFDALSEKADLILYNGHAGLGQNINAFARKGRVAAGKYQLMLLNGCQTFAYIDTTLTDRRRDANGGNDPDGTKYLDVIANALPGYANNLAEMSNQLFDAILYADQPSSYRDILSKMPSSHVVVVFGEEDNRFSP
jgi:hypothetical protein